MGNSVLAAVVLAGSLCTAVCGFDGDSAAAVKVTLLDGREITGRVTAIDDSQRVHLAGQSEPIPLSGLRRIATGHPKENSDDAGAVLRLVGEGVLQAKSVTIKNEKFQVRWASGPDLSFPLEAVRSVRFEKTPSSLFDRAGASPSTDSDQLIVRIRGKLRTVRGLIESMDAKQAGVADANRKFTVARNLLYGVVFAYVKKPIDRNGLCRVHLTDGSILPGRNPELPAGSGKLQLQLLEGGPLSVAWNSVTQITVVSDRLQYLSDLTPAAVAEQTIVALPQKWNKDRSVSGKPLSLAGTRYDKGIGVHARSQLTFATNGDYGTFAAVIGLNDTAGRKGDCNFVVLGDGRELFRKRMQGRDKPATVRVDVRGVRRLTLLVEPGKNLDIADHADWCDACLIRPAK